MRAGIAVDNWKLPVFREKLKAAGYTYEDKGEITPDSTMLMVETTDIVALGKVVTAANVACAVAGKPR